MNRQQRRQAEREGRRDAIKAVTDLAQPRAAYGVVLNRATRRARNKKLMQR